MQQEHKKSHRWKRLMLRCIPKFILGLGALAAYFSRNDYHRKPSQKELGTALTGYMRGKI